MIKAIDTHYKGYKFRSRLEARWAVFFDALGLYWEYEAEGYDLNGDWYLPDFHFPERKWFIEIKANEATKHERNLMFNLIDEINGGNHDPNDEELYKGYLFERGLWLPGSRIKIPWIHDVPEALLNGNMDYGYCFCVCTCGRVGVEFEGRGDRVCGNKHSNEDRGHSAYNEKLIKAYKCALSARFEHGESP